MPLRAISMCKMPLLMIMIAVIATIPCFSQIFMPFHLQNSESYIIRLEGSGKRHDGHHYKYLIVQITNDGFKFYLNKQARRDGLNLIPYTTKESIPFDPYHNKFRNYPVKQCWLLKTGGLKTEIPIKSALQRLQVLIHFPHYLPLPPPSPIVSISADSPLQTQIEDATTLATLSMLCYEKSISKLNGITNIDFNGGEILKVITLKDVQLVTELTKPQKINVGSLLLFAWKYENILVISFRGTHDDENWGINFKIKSKDINFKGYKIDNQVSGYVHSGMYSIMRDHLNEILQIFDVYSTEKRIILTGHSLGSGLAQMLLLNLLDENMKNKQDFLPIGNKGEVQKRDVFTPKVTHIMYSDNRPGPSLEIITFGGPAIMSGNIAKTLKDALDNYNRRTKRRRPLRHIVTPRLNRPDPKYSAIIYYKLTDPISKWGSEGIDYVDNLVNKGWDGTGSQAYLRLEGKSYFKVGKLGVQELKSKGRVYGHFGQPIIVGGSKWNVKKILASGMRIKIKEKSLALVSHAEYLEAHHQKFQEEGKKGWIVQSNNALMEYDNVYQHIDQDEYVSQANDPVFDKAPHIGSVLVIGSAVLVGIGCCIIAIMIGVITGYVLSRNKSTKSRIEYEI
eukprot:422676_1